MKPLPTMKALLEEKISREQMEREIFKGLKKLRMQATDPVFARALISYLEERVAIDGLAVAKETEDTQAHSLWRTVRILAASLGEHAENVINHFDKKYANRR